MEQVHHKVHPLSRCGGLRASMTRLGRKRLAGSPKLNRSKGRGQTNLDHLSSRLRGWDRANTSRPEKQLATETSTMNSQLLDLGVEGPPPRSMTRCSENLTEAARPTPLLTSKTTTKIATGNIRTMYEAGEAAQVAAEMKNYKIAQLGLCETRWTQSGQLRLSLGEYSGNEQEDAPIPKESPWC